MTTPEIMKKKIDHICFYFLKREVVERRGEERWGKEGKGQWRKMEIAICTYIPIIPTTVRTVSVEIIFAWEREKLGERCDKQRRGREKQWSKGQW
jgi:hypothetical protein